jgi:agmatine deiminase
LKCPPPPPTPSPPPQVIKIPAPGPLFVEREEAEGVSANTQMEEARAVGRRLPASYLNFYVGNGFVVMPTFDAPTDAEAKAALEVAFEGRVVETFKSRDILLGGGNVHCITQQIM